MNKIKLTINGAFGKMGAMILNLALADDSFELKYALEKKDTSCINKNILNTSLKYSSIDKCGFTDVDVIIDFSAVTSTMEIIDKNLLQRKPIPIVIGTTGFDEAGKKKIENASKKFPIVFSPNMSLGVNLLFKLVQLAETVLSDYDKEIIEIHHNLKKDSPSGTALKLAEILNIKKNYKYIYGREGITGPRKKDELGISAVRAGDIIGEHTVMFCGNSERVELIHRAHSRETFARGSLFAAKWIINKPKGLYNMTDVLGIENNK